MSYCQRFRKTHRITEVLQTNEATPQHTIVGRTRVARYTEVAMRRLAVAAIILGEVQPLCHIGRDVVGHRGRPRRHLTDSRRRINGAVGAGEAFRSRQGVARGVLRRAVRPTVERRMLGRRTRAAQVVVATGAMQHAVAGVG